MSFTLTLTGRKNAAKEEDADSRNRFGRGSDLSHPSGRECSEPGGNWLVAECVGGLGPCTLDGGNGGGGAARSDPKVGSDDRGISSSDR